MTAPVIDFFSAVYCKYESQLKFTDSYVTKNERRELQEISVRATAEEVSRKWRFDVVDEDSWKPSNWDDRDDGHHYPLIVNECKSKGESYHRMVEVLASDEQDADTVDMLCTFYMLRAVLRLYDDCKLTVRECDSLIRPQDKDDDYQFFGVKNGMLTIKCDSKGMSGVLEKDFLMVEARATTGTEDGASTQPI